MYYIDDTNKKEHIFPTYGRQFKTYKWYKPLFATILFFIFYLILSVFLTIVVAAVENGGSLYLSSNQMQSDTFASGYDNMDLANAMQNVLSLGSIVTMIPALWLASKIVRDRPFSSYSSARGGWSSKVFWKVFPIAFVCISIPIMIDELIVKHHLGDFQMRFTVASFLVLTILGPLQCIAEEYAFRGLLMQTFGSWFRFPIIAVVLQSVIFVLLHPYNTIGKIGILVTGTVFAITAWIGRGIEVSSAFHICNNMTIFYLQGMNMATITSESTTRDLIIEIATGAAYIIAIYIVSKRKNWFNKVRRDDAAAWNQKYDEKIARREAKKAAKAEKLAAKNAPVGEHEERAPGKHFKD